MKQNVLKFNKDLVKNYGEDINKGYIFGIHVEFPKNLHDLHSDLPF